MGRRTGVTGEQLRELASFRGSPHFDELERLVLEYAEAMTRTPVRVPDALFEALRARFTEAQMVELTAAIAWQNHRARFDHAMGIPSAGFSDGQAAAQAERP